MKNCDDPLLPVQTYKTHQRVEQHRYIAYLRPPPPKIKAAISTEWLETYLVGGCYKSADGIKWSFGEIEDDEIFRMYMSRSKKNKPQRP